MKVVVYAKEDLNSLEELIRKYVCLIPDKNIPKPLYSLAPFNQNNMKKIIKMSSNGNIDELNLIWIHDYQKDTKYSKPFNYIWYIFNYGGKNSLFSIFKKLEYVYDLNVKISNYFENFLSFEIKLKLTPLGFQKTQEIINIIFEYIDFILKKGVSKTLFDEAQKLSILNFHYSKLKIDFQYLSTLAKKLGNIPFKYLLIEEYLWENFDEKLICDSLTNFKLDNLIIFLNSKNIDKTNKFDLFYESNYSLEQIDDNLLVKGFTNNFNMIPMNPFLPISTKIVPISEMESLKEFTKIPKKIYSSEESEIFYKIDNKFKTPKCLIRLRIQLIE